MSPSRNTYRHNGRPKSSSRRLSKNALPPVDDCSPGYSGDDGSIHSTSNRRSSSRGDSGTETKPSSRPSSRSSRKRTNSNVTTTSEKESSYQHRSRRRSVAGWASSAVESVANRMKKDKDTFAALDEDMENKRRNSEQTPSLKKSMSPGSIGRRSPYFSSSKANSQAPKQSNATPEKKIVRARLDYEAKSSDELSFQTGSDIVVLNEVLDSWWMGELNGLRGLFPTTHVEVIDIPSPSLPSKADKSRSLGLISNKEQQGNIDSDAQSLDDRYGSSELDDDQDLTSRPLEHSPFIQGLGDTLSIETLVTEDHSSVPWTPKQMIYAFDTSTPPKSRSHSPPEASLSSSNTSLGRSPSHSIAGSGTHTPAKKVPPPPPPRRANSNAPVTAPPLPERKVHTTGGRNKGPSFGLDTESSSSLASYSGSTGSGSERYDRSPFESVSDLSAPSEVPTRSGDRVNKTNPFQSVHQSR